MNNTTHIIDSFRTAMREAGIEPPDNIRADGVLHRFHIAGHKHGSINGAYKLHLDGIKPAGYFEDFKAGIKTNWKADGQAKPLTQAERQQLEANKHQAAEQLKAKQLQASDKAFKLWEQAKYIKGRNHPYLQRKQVDAHRLKLLPVWTKRIKQNGVWTSVVVKNVLLVPLVSVDGSFWNVQAIFPEFEPLLGRDKDFVTGGRTGGCFHVFGNPTTERIIAEGYATAATLYEATGLQTYCAMSSGNLLAVAQAIHQARPNVKIIICADNDSTPGNPGLTAAKNAARAVGGFLAIPPIAGDFNDYAVMEGSA